MKRKSAGTPESGMFEDDDYKNIKHELDMLNSHVRSLEKTIAFYESRIKSLEVKALGNFTNNGNLRSLGYLLPSIGEVTTK